MAFTKQRVLKQALHNREITDTQYEVISNRYAFYNDSEWEVSVANNSVFIKDHYRGEDKVY